LQVGEFELEELEPNSALVLNWINPVLAALQIGRIGVEGVSALVSCLVLWWLSMAVVKLAFGSGMGRR